MSIIQDALRRKAEEMGGGTGGGSPAPALPPPPRDHGPSWRPMVVGLLIVLLLLAIGLALMAGALRRWSRTRAAPPVELSTALLPAPLVPPSPPPEPAAAEPAPPEPAAALPPAPSDPPGAPAEFAISEAPTAIAIETPAPAAPAESAEPAPPVAPAPEAAAAPPPPPAPAVWPRIELQGVIVRRDGGPATALINDRRVRVGESIEGVRLIAATEEDARLEFRGEQRTLRIGAISE